MIELTRAEPADLPALMQWVDDPATFTQWSGPGFRYPFTPESFAEDLLLERPSFILWESGERVGFGQRYIREGRSHMGRLVIAPQARARGLGTKLIGALLSLSEAQQRPEECSLFVYRDNTQAAKLYRRMGFETAGYPGELKNFDDCDYMIAQTEGVLRYCRAG
jgi:ribosomal protein S18 acetylase RimI-like enzyme